MAAIIIRKRSPRAPVISLREAVDRALKIYEKEGRHPANADIVATHLGYKSAENGAAKQTLASLGYYGLIERPSDGMISVSKSIEEFKFAPSEKLRTETLRKWLYTPNLFAELLEKFPDRLPSEASLKYELIQKGFNPTTADECLSAFIDSVQFASHTNIVPEDTPPAAALTPDRSIGDNQSTPSAEVLSEPPQQAENAIRTSATQKESKDDDSDRIPVRLAGGRKAWLTIPSPFFIADKHRLISQIELLLTDDEE